MMHETPAAPDAGPPPALGTQSPTEETERKP